MSMIKDVAIYLDMDGTICDFDAAIIKKIGYDDHQKIHQSFHDKSKTTEESKKIHLAMCLRVKNTKNFWSTLPWMPDGPHLWEFVKNTFHHTKIGVATAPLRFDDNCERDKWIWIEENLKVIEKRNYYCTTTKWNCVGKIDALYQVLIDDKQENILKWRDKGGIGIFHKNASDSISQLKSLLNGIK